MSNIEEALEDGRNVLVCDADAERLQLLLCRIAAPRACVLVDYRAKVPANVFEELEGKLRENQVVHVAIGARLDPCLLLAFRNLYVIDETLNGVVILSTSASWPSALGFKDEYKRADLFPLTVWGVDHPAKWIPPRFRQAVVLLHGIGEQRPGRPLRSFAEAVLPLSSNNKKYRSAYDELSFDYRKLIANVTEETQNHRGLDASIFTPRSTDLLEYYWAPKVEDTTWRHIVRWLWLLLSRRPRTHLVAVWAISWLLFAIGLVATFLGICTWFTALFTDWPVLSVAVASGFGLIVLETVTLEYFGDAARYLDDHPANDKIRTDIRRGAVELLGMLIRSRKYDRIVVVGHSLGSIIAYDALKHLWETEFWKAYEDGAGVIRQTALDEYEQAAQKLTPESNDDEIAQYQEKQSQLLSEIRALGNPWPVSDLITLGSPLAHAPYLVPNFDERRADGELPENPPHAFEPFVGTASLGKSFAIKAGFIQGQPRIPLRNGLFAVTRWTNLYFSTRLGLFGDVVSGPLRSRFGNGIRDRKVSTGSLFRDLTLLSHVSYWYDGSSLQKTKDRELALDVLIDVLDLNGERLGIPRFETHSYD